MCTDRRDFLRSTAGVVGATLIGSKFAFAATTDVDAIQQQQDVPELIRRLPKMTSGIVPITDDERKARIAKAQSLMGEQKIDAIYIEPGSTMNYYTGMRWSTSERMLRSDHGRRQPRAPAASGANDEAYQVDAAHFARSPRPRRHATRGAARSVESARDLARVELCPRDLCRRFEARGDLPLDRGHHVTERHWQL